MTVRIAGVVRESIVDGPGIRFTIFTQGCPHACRGCHNPESHDPAGGYDCTLDKILTEIKKDPLLSGVTFSGGEPFCQPEPLYILAGEIKKLGLHIMAYTGYLFEDLLNAEDENIRRLVELLDIIIDGPYVEAQRSLELKFRGSRNQRVIDVRESIATGKTVLAEGAEYQ